MKSKLIIGLFSVLFGLTQAYNPGLTATVSANTFVTHKQQLTQFILKVLQTVRIPDISFDQGYVKDNHWSLSRIVADQVNITLNEADNSVSIIINDVMAQFHSNDFHVKEGIISATGQLDAAFYRVQFIAGVNMTTSLASDGARLLQNFQPYKVQTNIDRDHVDVTVSGTIFAGLADIIAEIFRGPICDEVEIEVVDQLNKNIPEILNKKINRRDGYRDPIPIDSFDQIRVDTSIPQAWQAKEAGLQVGMSGFCFNNQQIEPAQAELGEQQLPALMFQDPTNDAEVQVFFGNWFANNFLKAFFVQNPGIGFALDSSVVGSPFDIATLNFVLPGLFQYYGMVNKECYCWIEFLEVGNFTFFPVEEKVKVFGRIRAHLYVVGGNLDGSNQEFLTLDAANATGNFSIGQGQNTGYNPPKPSIFLVVREILPGVLTIVDTRLPYVNAELIWRGFNMLLQKNGNLFPVTKFQVQETIKFEYPVVFKNLVSVTDLKVKYYDEWLGFSFNPVFTFDEAEFDRIVGEWVDEQLASEEVY